MIGENKRPVATDMRELVDNTIFELKRDQDKIGNEIDQQDFGNDVINRRMREIKLKISRYSPDAYRPSGAVVTDFKKLIEKGAMAFLENDPDAVEAVRNDPALLKRFSADLAL